MLETPAITIEEYLDLETRSPIKHEFDQGKLIEMAGGDIAHNLIKGEIFLLLKNLV